MDSFRECIKIANDVISENGLDVSIVCGDERELIPSIDIEKKTIVFPYLQEALLILDEIGTADQFRCFYLSLLMLQNDDYISGNELMDALDKLSIPICTNAESLYTSTLIKQLFIIFHELGHYYYKDEEKPSLFAVYYSEYLKILDESYKNIELIEKEKTQMLETFKSATDDVTALEDYFDNFDYKTYLTSYYNGQNNVNESSADLYASLLLLCLLPKLGLSNKTVVKSVVGAINYLHTITSYQNFTDGICDTSQHSQSLSVRLGFLKTMFALFDPYNYSQEDVLEKLIQLVKDLPSFEKYIIKWREGNLNQSESAEYHRLKERIDDYAKSLKQLYQNTSALNTKTD